MLFCLLIFVTGLNSIVADLAQTNVERNLGQNTRNIAVGLHTLKPSQLYNFGRYIDALV